MIKSFRTEYRPFERFAYALAHFFDGLVILLSLGFYLGEATWKTSLWIAHRHMNRRMKDETSPNRNS